MWSTRVTTLFKWDMVGLWFKSLDVRRNWGLGSNALSGQCLLVYGSNPTELRVDLLLTCLTFYFYHIHPMSQSLFFSSTTRHQKQGATSSRGLLMQILLLTSLRLAPVNSLRDFGPWNAAIGGDITGPSTLGETGLRQPEITALGDKVNGSSARLRALGTSKMSPSAAIL